MSAVPISLRLAPDVVAAARGDHGAFSRLVDSTRTMVASIALAVLRDVESSEDVAQEVYLTAWRALPTLREPASFLPWLRQLTRNRARQEVRSRVRRRSRISAGHPDELLAAAADPEPGVMERLVHGEERAALAAAIDALPEGSRDVVVLYYREGRSIRQVAELLEMREDAVKQRLARARSALRKELAAWLEDTAPSVGFTAAVMTAVSLAAPATAAAATVGGAHLAGSAAAKGSLPAWLAWAAPGLGGAAVGLLVGWGTVIFGGRKLARQARDERERHGVIRAMATACLLVLGFMVAIMVWPTREAAAGAFAVMAIGFAGVYLVWLPRVTRRRKNAELREAPEAATRRHARQRREAILGWVMGLLLGGGSILWLWIRIP
jgi:RNA polymerase sigma factor (sigma-70 family)